MVRVLIIVVAGLGVASLTACGGDSAPARPARGAVKGTYVNGIPARGNPALIEMTRRDRIGPR